MTRDEVIAAVEARPEADERERIAWASYSAALAAQEAGAPSSVVAGILVAFGEYAVERDVVRDLDAL